MLRLLRFAVVILLAVTVCACTSRAASSSAPPGGQAMGDGDYNEPNYYYEFDDILIPREIEPVEDASNRFEDATFKVSVRTFEGRVVVDDLFNFFVNNMRKDNWIQVAAVRSDKSVLLFRKPNKRCTIQIDDEFNTKVRVFAIQYKGSGPDLDMEKKTP